MQKSHSFQKALSHLSAPLKITGLDGKVVIWDLENQEDLFNYL
ncbi:hypothetical protein SLEP1_g13467 [Rubroshorea leprosula]|uniref:Uncharacterized protein n=1 Tax=Rubroshorea leprosula TaxID=152421 RepID=A0AAV5IKG2_9ROSI|nr:hypothetical protein SLEP1_g13467 [Rubroshorea leprosula]